MIDLFMPFRAFLKFENVCTDNNVFRMHYKVTVIILLVFTLLVTSKQFFGEPIHCMSDNDDNIDAINSFCWIYGTYTLKSASEADTKSVYSSMRKYSRVNRRVNHTSEDAKGAYPGVRTHQDGDIHIRHTYYQWVCFVLLGQAVMFYTPRYLWKIWEGGRLKTLASDLASPLVTKDWSEYRRGELVAYLTYTNMQSHNLYALRYAFCEILNLVNVVGQIFLLDIFLGGAFRNYGAAVAYFSYHSTNPFDTEVSPMDLYFPKVTKCSLRTYGPSGTIETRDRFCVLPLNIVNEKIFVILWFWLLILAFVSTVAVIFRLLVLSVAPLRTMMIMGQLRVVKRQTVTKIVNKFGFGDWFILYLLGKNMNPIIYKELVVELAKEAEQKMIV